jgi:CD2 antigen cytoplasmic tail-binding protein 2
MCLSVKSKNEAEQSGNAMDVDKHADAPSEIDHITHLASSLMSLGDTDIYSKTYEELVRSVRSSGNIEQDWIPPSADVKYEYKWDVPGATDGEAFGPFGEDEMRAWFKALYFGAAGEKVKVRQAGGQWGNWDDILS